MNKLRTLADVLRQAGFARITGLFLIFYLLCSTAVWLSEPTTLTFGDGLWFSFETVSTIGFGDIPAETPVARAITVVLSVISIILHRHAHGCGGELLQYAHQDASKGHHGAFYG